MCVRVNDYVHLDRCVFSLRLRIVATRRLTIQLATLTRELAVTTGLAPSARFICYDSVSALLGREEHLNQRGSGCWAGNYRGRWLRR